MLHARFAHHDSAPSHGRSHSQRPPLHRGFRSKCDQSRFAYPPACPPSAGRGKQNRPRAIPLAAPRRSRKRNRPLGRLIGRDSALQNSSVNGRSDQEPGQKTDSVLMKLSRKKNVSVPQMRPMSLLRPLYIRARDIGTFSAPKWPKGHGRDTGTLVTIIRDITNGPSVINDATRRAKMTVREPARQGHSPMSFYGFRILPLSDPPFTRRS